jgi:mRNA interferase MazF
MVKRGQVWWANLRPPLGSEPGFRRPVLVIQGDAYNASELRTTIVAALSSKIERASRPNHLRLSKRDTGLPKDSVLLPTQLLTIDKSVLEECVAVLPSHAQRDVAAALRQVLDL